MYVPTWHMAQAQDMATSTITRGRWWLDTHHAFWSDQGAGSLRRQETKDTLDNRSIDLEVRSQKRRKRRQRPEPEPGPRPIGKRAVVDARVWTQRG